MIKFIKQFWRELWAYGVPLGLMSLGVMLMIAWAGIAIVLFLLGVVF